jgi:hypothetical protein
MEGIIMGQETWCTNLPPKSQNETPCKCPTEKRCVCMCVRMLVWCVCVCVCMRMKAYLFSATGIHSQISFNKWQIFPQHLTSVFGIT